MSNCYIYIYIAIIGVWRMSPCLRRGRHFWSTPDCCLSVKIIIKQLLNCKMTSKRICPFDGDLTPQMKVHVGLREAADDTERNQEMKKIYERTLQLLRSGSQKTIGKGNDDSQNRTKGVGYHFEPPRLKQMVMNDKLELEHSKKIILPQAQQTCSRCRELRVFELNRCYHCIEFYCSHCLNYCTKCSEQFCSKCSLTIYEGEEHVECLNCYH